MIEFSKLTLSDEEQLLVNNSEWILTKRIIIDKVNQLMGTLSEKQKQVIEKEKAALPLAVVQSTPKISRGENYLQLPYMILDYPRCFDGENIFAIRTMFWWGNFFSITLQLSGIYKKLYEQKIVTNIDSLNKDFFICVNESQWHQHFEKSNYIPLKQFTADAFAKNILNKSFIKIAIQYPLQSWNELAVLLDNSFKEIIEMLKA